MEYTVVVVILCIEKKAKTCSSMTRHFFDTIIGASVNLLIQEGELIHQRRNAEKCGKCCERPKFWYCLTHDPLTEDSSYFLFHKWAF